MKNAKAKVIGVLQLINCKRDRGKQLKLTEVHAFPPRAVRLAHSLASQAAVAYENSQLYQHVGALFEGFVKASVTAIEQRDPTTSGHSLRVAKMTEGLAEVVDRVNIGPYADAIYAGPMKELRYAALLHDFGKVAVREEVLIKAKKLYPFHLTILHIALIMCARHWKTITLTKSLRLCLRVDWRVKRSSPDSTRIFTRNKFSSMNILDSFSK